MIPLKQALSSSLGKKYLMAMSGLGLVGFVVTHLLGNLQLYAPNAKYFNAYAEKLHSLGPGLWALEIGLIGIAVLHIALAFGLVSGSNKARGSRYQHSLQTKGGQSYSSPASKNMIITGLILLVFLVVHIAHMKFGVFDPETIKGMVGPTEDGKFNLYLRVKTAFSNPGWVVFYMVCMGVLFAHLRHGFWSAFQSLGALNRRMERPAVALGLIVGGLLAAGFLGIPVFFLVTGGH